MSKIIQLIIVLTTFLACRGKTATISQKAETQNLTHEAAFNESLFTEPFTISHNDRLIELDNIQQGFDSMQIRIWREQGLFQHRQLYILQNRKNSWSGIYYELTVDTNYANGIGSKEFLKGSAPFQVQISQKVMPTIGWTSFIDSLLELDLMTLPDSKSIQGMEVRWTHPAGFYIEVATKERYLFYRYYDPHRFANTFWQAKRILDIEALIQRQLGQ